ncbi:MAG: hypothetical protein EAZ60_08300 [Oscillatoriales cyanobacterium]|nr:MAG: hypothetical protein EAZ83_10620 [Oscillatoriales cyanobacterium]TAE98978.1 MAG: hypothetical protein EAZ79_06210 [Oscillatoriales cyanobacterium]TAF14045.1 MAG: hypothetical protein EAZ73_29490 [Oscillatoriales cyanobacterium]TAF30372.1 MAG: hypothetical protein EAZ69_22575 [Oscillatoriales cyanobacterium]TAF56986.1 MAG: hypothetical protein EAZ60_08300 [Oscillatoriales cyanobacterium]
MRTLVRCILRTKVHTTNSFYRGQSIGRDIKQQKLFLARVFSGVFSCDRPPTILAIGGFRWGGGGFI